MSPTKFITTLVMAVLLAGSAFAGVPALSWDIDHAQGVNDYFISFGGDQVVGTVFTVTGAAELTVTQLGAFDMNPDNEPYWDENNPPLSEHGFQHDHGVAIFSYPDMLKLGEVIIPAGTSAPIQDEGYRYMPLTDSVVLIPGRSYVLAAWWAGFNIADGGVDTFYLISDTPGDIPSEFNVLEDITLDEGCFNPNPTNGPSVDAPFVFYMYWGLYAGGANFQIEAPVATDNESWGAVKSLYR